MASIEPTEPEFLDESPPAEANHPADPPGFVWVFLVISLLTALVYGVPYLLDRVGYAYESGRARAASEALAKLDQGGALARASELFRMATHAASPAVVHIRTQVFGKDGGMNVGSGVVIDRDRGYIVTNHHVIRDADTITIRVGRTEMLADLVGSDPRTDLAVVRAKGSLPMAASWGDSEKLEAGDWVLAIGSPFGLERTVSAGIVSATSRNNLGIVGADAYEDFLQVDVAINPGNSGGPLVDLRGHVVGINTAISPVTPDRGGSQGIGFAISATLARRVVDQLIQSGKVTRSYLGIVPQLITPDRAEQLGVVGGQGASIGAILPGEPAERAGLRPDDVITAIDGHPIADPSSLRNRTFTLDPGAEVPVDLVRSGKAQSIRVKVAALPEDPALAFFGFGVKDAPRDTQAGVEVDRVVPGSPAARAGLAAGTRIVAVGRRRIYSKAEFDVVIAQLGGSPGLALGVIRDGKLEGLIVGKPSADSMP